MLNRHFFKILIGFTSLILLGLVGLFLLDEYDKSKQGTEAKVQTPQ